MAKAVKKKRLSTSVTVPSDYIVYRCKIRKGVVIELPLPPDLIKSDVERIYAFLKTQVDDDVIME